MPEEPDDTPTNPGGGGDEDLDLGPESPEYGDHTVPVRRTTRPSLDTLQHDQRLLVYEGEPARTPPLEPIVDGFADRRGLINWYQAALVRTFGHIEKKWPATDLERDLALVDALTEKRPHDREGDEWLHTRVVETVVLPACGTSYRHLRDKSAERTSTSRYADDHDTGWEDIDPEQEFHLGMRPGFSRLDAEQAAVLDELWGGFDTRGEVGEWLHSLHPATYGTFGGGDAADILADEYGMWAFMEDDPQARWQRELFAIVELLPAFAEAASRLNASEQSETKPDNTWRTA